MRCSSKDAMRPPPQRQQGSTATALALLRSLLCPSGKMRLDFLPLSVLASGLAVTAFARSPPGFPRTQQVFSSLGNGFPHGDESTQLINRDVKTVAVIGAGASGLIAARELIAHQFSVRVFERDSLYVFFFFCSRRFRRCHCVSNPPAPKKNTTDPAEFGTTLKKHRPLPSTMPPPYPAATINQIFPRLSPSPPPSARDTRPHDAPTEPRSKSGATSTATPRVPCSKSPSGRGPQVSRGRVLSGRLGGT